MALMIRLRQQGRKNAKAYRLVLTDKRNPRDGKYIEKLGWYDPLKEENKNLFVDGEKVQHWLDHGAVMSENAKALIKRFAPDVITNFLNKKEAKRMQLKAKSKDKNQK